MKKTKINVLDKKIKTGKIATSDKDWVAVNVREEKKAMKLAQKARMEETHLDEFVPSTHMLTHETNIKMLKTDNNVGNSIVNSIADIIESAEKKTRKDKEKILINQKLKRIAKQKDKKVLATYTDMSEVYPLHTSSVIQEHSLYDHIMKHGLNVSSYVRMLFLGLEPLHGLSDTWLRRLLLAAQYHDVGSIDGAKAHHKHSYVRIKSDFGIVIPDEDREMVALLARYHRKALPCQEHKEFAILSVSEQEKFCKAASILRIADALDYGHQGVIEKIDMYINKARVTLICHSSKNLSQEKLRILKKGDLFERTFRKAIECKQS